MGEAGKRECVSLTEILTREVNDGLDSPAISVIRKTGDRAWKQNLPIKTQ